MWAPPSLELVFFEKRKRQERDSGECGQRLGNFQRPIEGIFCQLSLDESNQGLRHSGSIGTGRVAE